MLIEKYLPEINIHNKFFQLKPNGKYEDNIYPDSYSLYVTSKEDSSKSVLVSDNDIFTVRINTAIENRDTDEDSNKSKADLITNSSNLYKDIVEDFKLALVEYDDKFKDVNIFADCSLEIEPSNKAYTIEYRLPHLSDNVFLIARVSIELCHVEATYFID